MKAEIITIGDEILIGQILDSNASFMGEKLTSIGIDVAHIHSVGDEPEGILNALEDAQGRCDLVLISGGLGPTKDDITKRCFCAYFRDELKQDRASLAHIKSLFQHLDEPLLPAILSQAMIPSRAIILKNKFGTAPGMWMEKNNMIYIAMPGVPYEMKAILNDEVLPRLVARFDRPFILQKTMLTYGMGESRIAEKIVDWEDNLPKNMKLAYLPQPGKVRLRVTIRGKNLDEIEQTLTNQLIALEKILGESFGGYEDQHDLQDKIAERLVQSGLSMATSESCTGGKIAALFTEIPGASKYFKGGLIPYETAMKTKILGVSEKIIDKYSVVSKEVAREMAIQTQRLFQSDIGLSTTGNAGPTKGDSTAEIGTVFIAVAIKEEVVVREYHLGRLREKVVNKAINEALVLLNHTLLEKGF